MIRKLYKKATKNRKTKVASLAVVLTLAFAGSALAFVLLYSGVNGSALFSAGNGAATGDTQNAAAVTISASGYNAATGGGSCSTTDFGDGCSEQVNVTAANDTSQQETITALTPTITIDATHAAAGCQAAWFSLWLGNSYNLPIVLSANQSGKQVSNDAEITWNDESGVNESACQGATVTETFTGTTSP